MFLLISFVVLLFIILTLLLLLLLLGPQGCAERLALLRPEESHVEVPFATH